MVCRLHGVVLEWHWIDGGYSEQGHGAGTISQLNGGLSAAPDGFAWCPGTPALPSAARWAASSAWPCIVDPAFAHSTAPVAFDVGPAALSSSSLCPGPSSGRKKIGMN